jgi:hypothetical protein
LGVDVEVGLGVDVDVGLGVDVDVGLGVGVEALAHEHEPPPIRVISSSPETGKERHVLALHPGSHLHVGWSPHWPELIPHEAVTQLPENPGECGLELDGQGGTGTAMSDMVPLYATGHAKTEFWHVTRTLTLDAPLVSTSALVRLKHCALETENPPRVVSAWFTMATLVFEGGEASMSVTAPSMVNLTLAADVAWTKTSTELETDDSAVHEPQQPGGSSLALTPSAVMTRTTQ